MYRLRQWQRHRHLPTIVYGFLALTFFAAAVFAAQDDPVDLTRLPLGDNKASTEPQVGYLWACQTSMGGGGAFAEGPWIDSINGTWNRLIKITVDGAVEWANYQFVIEIQGDQRIFTGNGLPNHTTGIYPVQASDDAYNYDRNPNSISEQELAFALPLNPTLAAEASCVGGVAGIAVNGVPIFNGFDAEGRDAVAHEIQDACGGHPEITGQYHYHDISGCLEERAAGNAHSELVGYALDGFGIYGYRSEDGALVSNADLDECHGHVHAVAWDGQMVEMYHYHATAEFPYSVGCLRGEPAEVRLGSAEGGPQEMGGQPPQGGTPPQGGQPPQGGTPPPPPQGGQPPQGGPPPAPPTPGG